MPVPAGVSPAVSGVFWGGAGGAVAGGGESGGVWCVWGGAGGAVPAGVNPAVSACRAVRWQRAARLIRRQPGSTARPAVRHRDRRGCRHHHRRPVSPAPPVAHLLQCLPSTADGNALRPARSATAAWALLRVPTLSNSAGAALRLRLGRSVGPGVVADSAVRQSVPPRAGTYRRCPRRHPPPLRRCSARAFPALAEDRLQAHPGCPSTGLRSRGPHPPASARASGCTTPMPGWGRPEQARSHLRLRLRRRSRRPRCRRRLRPPLAQETGIRLSLPSNHPRRRRRRLPIVPRPRRQ